MGSRRTKDKLISVQTLFPVRQRSIWFEVELALYQFSDSDATDDFNEMRSITFQIVTFPTRAENFSTLDVCYMPLSLFATANTCEIEP